MSECPECKKLMEILLTHRIEKNTENLVREPEVFFCKKCKLVVIQSQRLKVLILPYEEAK
jgi:uncharacterized protein YbaR (Trm112 family)